jgi:hypothetical protein
LPAAPRRIGSSTRLRVRIPGGRYFRFNPLRGRKPSAFALGVLLRKIPGNFFRTAVFILRSFIS